jgi:hypothetical protein
VELYSMLWVVIKQGAISWRRSLTVLGEVFPSVFPHQTIRMDFLSELLQRGLSLSTSSSSSIVDQFARDNVGNYVLQSILKRLHREILCLSSCLNGKGGIYSLENERDVNHMSCAIQLVSS